MDAPSYDTKFIGFYTSQSRNVHGEFGGFQIDTDGILLIDTSNEWYPISGSPEIGGFHASSSIYTSASLTNVGAKSIIATYTVQYQTNIVLGEGSPENPYFIQFGLAYLSGSNATPPPVTIEGGIINTEENWVNFVRGSLGTDVDWQGTKADFRSFKQIKTLSVTTPPLALSELTGNATIYLVYRDSESTNSYSQKTDGYSTRLLSANLTIFTSSMNGPVTPPPITPAL